MKSVFIKIHVKVFYIQVWFKCETPLFFLMKAMVYRKSPLKKRVLFHKISVDLILNSPNLTAHVCKKRNFFVLFQLYCSKRTVVGTPFWMLWLLKSLNIFAIIMFFQDYQWWRLQQIFQLRKTHQWKQTGHKLLRHPQVMTLIGRGCLSSLEKLDKLVWLRRVYKIAAITWIFCLRWCSQKNPLKEKKTSWGEW